MRTWLWVGTVADGLVFLLGVYLAAGGVDVARENPGATAALATLVLLLALPVLCIAAPLSAWKAYGRGRSGHALALVAAPLVYGAYVVWLLLEG